MIESTTTIHEFLASIYPFSQLSITSVEKIAEKLEPLRYRMGQAILVRETLPARIAILYLGQARLLGYAPGAFAPDTLELLKPGSIIGWTSLLRGVPSETAIASVETLCLTLKASDFLSLLELEPAIANAFRNYCSLIEVFDLLGAELERRGKIPDNLKELATAATKQGTILNLPPGKTPLQQLDPNKLWLVSSKGSNYTVGDRLNLTQAQAYITGEVRLVGFTDPTLSLPDSLTPSLLPDSSSDTLIWSNAPFAPERPEEVEEIERSQPIKYPHIVGRGPVDGTLACFQMLAQHLRMPFRRDVLRRALVSNKERTGSISIQLYGALAELMGLTSQLVNVPAVAISKLPTPVLIPWQDSYAILYKATEFELVLGIPEQGIVRKKPADFAETWGEEGQVLLLQPTKETPQKRFGLSWFLPAIKKHRTVLELRSLVLYYKTHHC
ncbi:cyclic nucleotide-binding domain-containing protein [Nostoc sp. CHAB 5784]|uniref:cysteine peptidase family C39 domain-containing protein n=1 Tax=Nostoc mirabile TaxID=2907820 RepID=UPI001E3794C3|nr:cysteine peptidase family C39 domain-containing protein [Nostoc mirabile]MCC5669150.1 cyclic nucleotide-binding domain-containing protein [Nostoc mirabile CHAB5784]